MTPWAHPNRASGCQNQDIANVACNHMIFMQLWNAYQFKFSQFSETQKNPSTSRGPSDKERGINQMWHNNQKDRYRLFARLWQLTIKCAAWVAEEGASSRRLSGFLPKLCFACDSQSGQRHIATCDRSRINESSVRRQFVSQGLANIARRRVGQMPDRAKASQFVQLGSINSFDIHVLRRGEQNAWCDLLIFLWN